MIESFRWSMRVKLNNNPDKTDKNQCLQQKKGEDGKVPWRKHIEKKKVFHIWGMITLRSIFKLFLMTFHVLQKEEKRAWRRKTRRQTTKKRLWHNNVMDLGSYFIRIRGELLYIAFRFPLSHVHLIMPLRVFAKTSFASHNLWDR